MTLTLCVHSKDMAQAQNPGMLSQSSCARHACISKPSREYHCGGRLRVSTLQARSLKSVTNEQWMQAHHWAATDGSIKHHDVDMLFLLQQLCGKRADAGQTGQIAVHDDNFACPLWNALPSSARAHVSIGGCAKVTEGMYWRCSKFGADLSLKAVSSPVSNFRTAMITLRSNDSASRAVQHLLTLQADCDKARLRADRATGATNTAGDKCAN